MSQIRVLRDYNYIGTIKLYGVRLISKSAGGHTMYNRIINYTRDYPSTTIKQPFLGKCTCFVKHRKIVYYVIFEAIKVLIIFEKYLYVYGLICFYR